MFVTGILFGFISILLYAWYRSRREKQKIFRKLCIPGPEPSVLFGNISEMDSEGVLPTLLCWTRKYGKVFGYFEGTTPVMVISEPKLVQSVLIKDFHKFHSRKHHLLDPDHTQFEDMFLAKGDNWKRLRTISAPSFTAKRMKEMSPLINVSVDSLMNIFEKRFKDGTPFDIHNDFGRLTLDVIGSCAFGVDTNCLTNPESEFLHKTKEIFSLFDEPPSVKFLMKLITLFPGIVTFGRKLSPHFLTITFPWHYNIAKKIIEERQRNPSNRVDFINLMLEANVEQNKGTSETKPLTTEEMQAQIALFLLAGYETTSTALGFTAYELAMHPEVQEKLQEEIDQHFSDMDFQPDYNSVQNLKYMDLVFNEVLRMYPIAEFAVSRTCFEDHQFGDIHIPKGMQIIVNVTDLHFNPELWSSHDPAEFRPERFQDGKKDLDAMSWIPFGAGPRICAGMRFAVVEYKIALARFLKKFSVKRCSKTKVPCPVRQNGIHSPSEGVYVTIEKRIK